MSTRLLSTACIRRCYLLLIRPLLKLRLFIGSLLGSGFTRNWRTRFLSARHERQGRQSDSGRNGGNPLRPPIFSRLMAVTFSSGAQGGSGGRDSVVDGGSDLPGARGI